MKKRILSLLLAFAMAATLAPATALVGSDSAYAASGSEVNPILSIKAGDTWSASGSEVSTLKVIRGHKYKLVLKDTANSDHGFVAGNTDTTVTPSIDGSATNEIKISNSAVTTAIPLLNGANGKYETAITVDVPANYNGAETRTISLVPTNNNGATLTGGTKTIALTIAPYEPTLNISLSKNKWLIAKTSDTGKVSISVSNMTGISDNMPLIAGSITYSSAITGGSGNMAAASVFSKTTGIGNEDVNITIPTVGNVTAGSYTYTVTTTVTINGTAQTDTVSDTFTLVVGDGTMMTLEADGGKIESAGWVLNSGSEYSKESSQGGTIALPYATKAGYEFVGWSTTGTAAGLVGAWDTTSYSVSTANYLKAVWKNKESIYLNGNAFSPANPQKGPLAAGIIGTQELVSLEIGKPINKGVRFTAVGYTMTGWSTQPGATVPLYKPEEVVTEKIFRDLTAANKADTLYATWAPKTYTVKFVANFPDGVKESPYSKQVPDITKTFGDNTEAWPACTFYSESGVMFDKWTISVQKDNYVTADGYSTGTADGLIEDVELLGTAGMRDVVYVYADWKAGYSQALLPEAGQKAYKIIENVNAAALSIDAGESGKKGWLVEKWTDSDGQEHSAMTVNANNTITTNAVNVPKHTVMTPTYYKNPIEYPVVYDLSVPGGSTNKLSATFNVTETFNLHQPTAANLVFGGYTAYVYDTDSDTTIKKIGQFTRTASGSKLLDAFTKVQAETPMAGDASYGQYGVLFVANWLYKINKAQVAWAPTTVPYGTSLFAIADQLTVNLFYEETATSGRVNELGTLIGPNAGVKSITWTSATPVYDQKPSKLTKYRLNGVVVPDESVVSASANLTIYAEITMQSKVGDGIVALDVADIPSIDLPATAVAADLYAALNTVNTVYVKGDDAKNYLAGLIKSEDDINHDWVDAADDFLLPNDNDELATWIANPDGEGHNFLFMSKLGNVNPLDDSNYKLTESERAGLEYVDNAQNEFDQYAFVYVNVGGKATPGTVMNPEITDVPEVDDEKLPELKGGAVYRLYNPNNGDHLYTLNEAERTLLRTLGWNEEKPTFQAVAYDAEGAVPVYRLWNPNSGEHFYTTSKGERNAIVKAGWNYDGVFFYAYSAKSKLGVPVYRVFNPNATKADSHHYTAKVGEYNALAKLGWNKEGIKFRAVKAN